MVVENRFSENMDFSVEFTTYSYDQYCRDTKKIWCKYLTIDRPVQQPFELPKPNYIRMASPIEIEKVSSHLEKG